MSPEHSQHVDSVQPSDQTPICVARSSGLQPINSKSLLNKSVRQHRHGRPCSVRHRPTIDLRMDFKMSFAEHLQVGSFRTYLTLGGSLPVPRIWKDKYVRERLQPDTPMILRGKCEQRSWERFPASGAQGSRCDCRGTSAKTLSSCLSWEPALWLPSCDIGPGNSSG